MIEKNVQIFTTPTCMYCKMAKEFFQKNNVEYEEVDVSIDEAGRKKMLEVSGQMGVPVILVGGEMVIGFNESKLSELLGL